MKPDTAEIFTWRQRGKNGKYGAVLPRKGAVIVCREVTG